MWFKLKTFITVVETGGFAKAAKKLGISTASATRHIHDLESQYNTKLLIRTTRHVSLTDSGTKFHCFALQSLEANNNIQSELDTQKHLISGNIKIGVPASLIYNCFRGIPKYLLDKHPELSFEIIQGNHILNMLNGSFDIALHCGEIPDINLYSTKIGAWQKIICASPEYIKKHGEPQSLHDLTKHNCVDHSLNHSRSWRLVENGKFIKIPVSGNLRADSSLSLGGFAEDGIGITYLPNFTISRALQTKKLIPILKKNWPESLPIHAVYSQRQGTSKKITALLNALNLFFTQY
jgi:DNA-binding transcriptional LysR family regulator